MILNENLFKPTLWPVLFLPPFPHPTTTAVKYEEKTLLLSVPKMGEITIEIGSPLPESSNLQTLPYHKSAAQNILPTADLFPAAERSRSQKKRTSRPASFITMLRLNNLHQLQRVHLVTLQFIKLTIHFLKKFS